MNELPARLSWDEIERLASEDPDDRAIREAHGFSYEDDFEDRSLLCRNGCGATYFEIASGRIRVCPNAPRTDTVGTRPPAPGEEFPFGREVPPHVDPVNPFSAQALFARGHWAEARVSASEPQTAARASER